MVKLRSGPAQSAVRCPSASRAVATTCRAVSTKGADARAIDAGQRQHLARERVGGVCVALRIARVGDQSPAADVAPVASAASTA